MVCSLLGVSLACTSYLCRTAERVVEFVTERLAELARERVKGKASKEGKKKAEKSEKSNVIELNDEYARNPHL